MFLIVDRFKKNATSASDMLFYMGFLAKAVTPTEALSEISNTYRAVVILSPESLPDTWDFIRRIRSYNKEIPIFALGNPDESCYDLFAKVLKSRTFNVSAVSKIIDYTCENDLPQPGSYKLAGLDISTDISTPMYFDTKLPFTRTEAMIIRYFIRTYPRHVKPKEILKHAFRERRTPEISNVRTHISIINKKFRSITNRNLIEMAFKEGYRILTPEVMANCV